MTAARPVHVVCGKFANEEPCGEHFYLDGVEETRREFIRRTNDVWRQLTGRPPPGEPGTYAELAARVGGARGIPAQAAAELAEAFEATWGRWSVWVKLHSGAPPQREDGDGADAGGGDGGVTRDDAGA